MRFKKKMIAIYKTRCLRGIIKTVKSHISYLWNKFRFYLYLHLPVSPTVPNVIPHHNTKRFKVLYVDMPSEFHARCNVNGVIKAYNKVGRLVVFDYRKLAQQYGQLKMNKILLKTAIEFQPNLIHLGKSELIYGSTIKEIKNKIDTYIVHFYGDFRWGPQSWVVDIGKYADCTLLYHKEPSIIKQYKNLGIKNIGFWWVGTDQEIFYPRNKKKNYDIVFMANNANFLSGHKLRRELIDAIICKDWNIHIYGDNWEYLSSIPNVHIHPFLVEEDFANICSAAKITLGVNAVNNIRMYASWRRTFNSMACGTFHLTHYIPGLEDIFENKKHLVWFNSIPEAVELIEYYLCHNQERKKIAKAGKQEVLVHHTWDARILQIINLWKKYKKKETKISNKINITNQ